MTENAVIVGALLFAILFQCAVLGWLVRRMARGDVMRREQDHAFMLGVFARMKTDDVNSVAETEALIEEHRGEVERDNEDSIERASEVSRQQELGWPGYAAEGRAAMVMHGLDPDDQDAIKRWNATLGEIVQ